MPRRRSPRELQGRRRRLAPIAAALLAVGAGAALAQPARVATQLDGEPHDAVRAEFAAICASMREGDLEFYGRGRVRALENQLAQARDPVSRRAVQAELGQQLLQLGRIDDAIEVLEAALRDGVAAASADPAQALDPALRLRVLSSLALAHLQASEDANCVLHGNPTSCILPIRGESVHRVSAEHATRAGDLAVELLRAEPRNLQLAWVANLARMLSGTWPEGVPESARLPDSAFLSGAPFPAWRDRSADLGLDHVDLAGGAIMDDFDGDGLLDLVTSSWDPCDSLKAFRSRGDGTFEDVTARWGLDVQLGGLNVVHADYDGDGRLDLLVLRGGWLFAAGRMRKSLLRNDVAGASGRFVDVTRAAGVAEPAYPTQTAAWADYDGDGDLDLYVGHEHSGDEPYPSQLFRNDGGRFANVTEAMGVENLRMAKAVTWGDYDGDGDPDLYVSNYGFNRLYRNDRDCFVDVAESAGVLGPDGWTFATWFFDYDNDGDLDLYFGDYRTGVAAVAASYFGTPVEEGNPHLYRNEGGGRFAEVSRAMGLVRPQLPMGANYGDLDNDGWLDFYLGTGDPSLQSLVPNAMYRNVSGRGFEDVTFSGGFGHLQKGHGVAFGDLDNDGDQDLLHQLGGFYPTDAFRDAVFENPGPARSWVTLRLEGRQANRFGVGARVAVRTRGPAGERWVHVVGGTGGSFGGNSHQLEIGLGDAETIEEVRIRWPGSGTDQRLRGVPIRSVVQVVEGDPTPRPIAARQLRLGG
jgi:hypothetical protein